MNVKEKRFLNELEAMFTGAEVDGDSGFVNFRRSLQTTLDQGPRRYFHGELCRSVALHESGGERVRR